MRYIDTGRRDPDAALGSWFLSESAEIAALRIQSGFFSVDSMGTLAEPLERLANENGETAIIVGSNDAATSVRDIKRLRLLMSVPRDEGRLGVVSFSGAFFHPKVYHIRRTDGTQTAYVGSANLTKPGVQSLHVEAGLILDSREGDAEPVLRQVADAIDWWFDEPHPGFNQIHSVDDIQVLLENGILCVRRVGSSSSGSSDEGSHASGNRPRLAPLFIVPELPVTTEAPEEELPTSPYDHHQLSLPRDGLPEYILVAPGLDRPTVSSEALTGSSLPGGACGLIIQLNHDSARHFFGGTGTSNISIPVATLATLRFGEYQGHHVRPRVQFPLQFRYQTDGETVAEGRAGTNIMAYGFASEETGHGDIRMLIPAAVKRLIGTVRQGEFTIPEVGHVALLEWPSLDLPEFRLTFLDPDSDLAHRIKSIFELNIESRRTVGRGASWLFPEQVPSW